MATQVRVPRAKDVLGPSLLVMPKGGDWIDGLVCGELQCDHIQSVLLGLLALVENQVMVATARDMKLVASDRTSETRAQDALFYIFSLFVGEPMFVDILGDHLSPLHRAFLKTTLPRAFTSLCSGEPTALTRFATVVQAQAAWTAGVVLALRQCSALEVAPPTAEAAGRVKVGVDTDTDTDTRMAQCVDIGRAIGADGSTVLR